MESVANLSRPRFKMETLLFSHYLFSYFHIITLSYFHIILFSFRPRLLFNYVIF